MSLSMRPGSVPPARSNSWAAAVVAGVALAAVALAALVAGVVLEGCAPAAPAAISSAGPIASAGPTASAAPSASTSTSAGPRPSSTAVVTVISPRNGAAITGRTVHVEIGLSGATIVAATTTDIRPDQGHIHLYIDNNLVSMNYASSIEQAVPPGTHVLRAEFVAADHAPFDPRVVTPDIVFTVKP